MRKLITLILGLFCTGTLWAQSAESPEAFTFEDIMRADGKVAVTIVVASIILAGMVVYLVNADRRLKNLEEEVGIRER